MKLLLVLGNDETFNSISRYAKPLGFDLIRYNSILKAMDNIDEIDPSALIISAKDFPRHWKTMVQFVRSERAKSGCSIILLKGGIFSTEEAAKASFLGVSGVVEEALDNPAAVDRLRGILGRYMPVMEKRRARRFHYKTGQKSGFVFNSPADGVLVTGTVKDLSAGGLAFLPDDASLIKDAALDTELPDCSLRAGDSILSPICRLAGTGGVISVEFLSFPEGELEALTEYLENLSSEELSGNPALL